jgi:hypothetical protein
MSRISFYEGQQVEISITGIVDPEFGQGWVATLPDGTKITLDYKYYAPYQFTKGQKVRGFVDRINCAGKVYFEPEHPVYKTGECYDFEVVTTSKKELINGCTENCVTVIDYFRNHIDVVFHEERDIGKKTELRVKAIHKGRPVLEIPEDTVPQKFKMPFFVKSVTTENGKQFYILENNDKKQFLLPVHWYRFHKIEVGQTILCRVWHSATKNDYRLEPVHPCYSEGENVELIPFFRRDTLWTRDCFGQIVKIQGFIDPNSPPMPVKCSVLRIRKGKPVFLIQNVNRK